MMGCANGQSFSLAAINMKEIILHPHLCLLEVDLKAGASSNGAWGRSFEPLTESKHVQGNKMEPRTEPCGTPQVTGRKQVFYTIKITVCTDLFDGVVDCIECCT